MPTTIETATEVLSRYRDFPSRLRSSQEDIIKRLRGQVMRGKLIYEMSPEQVHSISRRLYHEAERCLRVKIQEPVRVSKLEVEVQGQEVLFDNRKRHYQY